VVISTSAEKVFEIENVCKRHGIPVNVLGTVTQGSIVIDGERFGGIREYKNEYENAIGNYMTREVTV